MRGQGLEVKYLGIYILSIITYIYIVLSISEYSSNGQGLDHPLLDPPYKFGAEFLNLDSASIQALTIIISYDIYLNSWGLGVM